MAATPCSKSGLGGLLAASSACKLARSGSALPCPGAVAPGPAAWAPPHPRPNTTNTNAARLPPMLTLLLRISLGLSLDHGQCGLYAALGALDLLVVELRTVAIGDVKHICHALALGVDLGEVDRDFFSVHRRREPEQEVPAVLRDDLHHGVAGGAAVIDQDLRLDRGRGAE